MSHTEVHPLTAEQNEKLAVWRAFALERMPYMATTLYALRPMAAPGLGTFAVDIKLRLYIDFTAAEAWSDQLCAQVLLHECSHILQDHSGAAVEMGVDGQTQHTWNVAADAAINDDLRDAGCVEMTTMGVLPKDIHCPDYLTAVEYFTQIRHQASNTNNPGGGGSGDGDPYEGCGSVSGGGEAPCELGDDDAGGAAPAATPAEVERVRVQTAAAIREAASKNPGSVAGRLAQEADLVLAPPKVPWQQVLARVTRTCARAVAGNRDMSLARRNARRHNDRIITSRGQVGRRIVVPGHVTYPVVVAAVRDTSGSMSEHDLSLVTSEVEGIARGLGVRGNDFVVLDVDTEVAAVRNYRRAATLNEVSGRGGTDMRVGIEAALALKPRPDVVVVLTDGATPWARVPVAHTTKVVACVIGPHADQYAAGVPSWIHTVTVDAV